MLIVIMLSVIGLNVIMLNVMAPFLHTMLHSSLLFQGISLDLMSVKKYLPTMLTTNLASYSQNFFSSKLMNSINKLERLSLESLFSLVLCNTLAYW